MDHVSILSNLGSVASVLVRQPARQQPPQLFQLGIAPMVAGFVDQAFGFREIANGEVIVGKVEPHTGTGGDAEGLVEIVGRATGSEAEGQKLDRSRSAKELDGLIELSNGVDRTCGMSAAERKMVEAGVEGPALLFTPLDRSTGPPKDFRRLPAAEKQGAAPITAKRVENGILRFERCLQMLGLLE
jgi:hypothetical protein